MIFDWNEEKNTSLRVTRGVCFEDVIEIISNGEIIDVLPSNDPEKYPNQRQFVVFINEYFHLVPFVEDKQTGVIFLKTIIPSRKLKNKY